MNIQYSRTNKLLRKKFFQYLLPTMITYAALSLNEFVDSMLVSNLLDSDAMAVISLGMPVMLVMAAAYSLLGGGATVYALSLGSRDHENAGKSLTAAVAVGLAAGVLLLVLGNLLFGPLSRILCHNTDRMGDEHAVWHGRDLVRVPAHGHADTDLYHHQESLAGEEVGRAAQRRAAP